MHLTRALPDEPADTLNRPFLPFHMPEITEDEVRSVVETLRSGWLTTGPKVKELEADFTKYVGCRHSVAVNSGTAALHLALDAVGVREGDEVIVPTMTFAATAEVVLYAKATPVLVDCRADTLNIDPLQMEKAITPRTKAVIPVHFGGYPCDMDEIWEIARAHNLRVIEDAAHALPARYRDKMIGTIGDVTCFSFYATKTITTGEGGMATTSNDDYADRMRMMSLHGISEDAWKRYSAEGSWHYEIVAPGYKYNLTDIAGAIGVEQLKKCDRLWAARKRIAARYNDAFADLPQIRRPSDDHQLEHAWHLYVIQLDLEALSVTRNEFIELLRAKNVGTSVHFMPLHLHPYYREAFGYRPSDFPRASAAYQRIVSLPIFPKMSDDDVDRVIGEVRAIARKYRR